MAALVVVLIGVSRILLPFTVRTGVHVFQTADCAPPGVRIAQGRNNYSVKGEVLGSDFGAPAGTNTTPNPCWSPSVNRAEQGGVLIALAIIGAAAAVRLLREPMAS